MPQLTFSTAMTANQLGLNPVSGWQYEYIPAAWARGAAIKLLLNSTTTGNRVTITTGSQTIQERSPVPGGGTAGTIPSDFTVPAVVWRAMPGDRVKLAVDEVAGGTPTVNGVLIAEPL